MAIMKFSFNSTLTIAGKTGMGMGYSVRQYMLI
jgi:hypothetical protein